MKRWIAVPLFVCLAAAVGKSDPPAPRVIIDFEKAVRTIAWSPDSKWLALSLEHEDPMVIDPTYERGKWRLDRLEKEEIGDGSGVAIAFSPDGKEVWVVS